MTTEVRHGLVDELGLPPQRVHTEVFSAAAPSASGTSGTHRPSPAPGRRAHGPRHRRRVGPGRRAPRRHRPALLLPRRGVGTCSAALRLPAEDGREACGRREPAASSDLSDRPAPGRARGFRRRARSTRSGLFGDREGAGVRCRWHPGRVRGEHRLRSARTPPAFMAPTGAGPVRRSCAHTAMTSGGGCTEAGTEVPAVRRGRAAAAVSAHRFGQPRGELQDVLGGELHTAHLAAAQVADPVLANPGLHPWHRHVQHPDHLGRRAEAELGELLAGHARDGSALGSAAQ